MLDLVQKDGCVLKQFGWLQKNGKIDEGLIRDDLKAKQRQFAFDSQLNNNIINSEFTEPFRKLKAHYNLKKNITMRKYP